MDLSTTQQILVSILAGALAVFLVLAIVIAVCIIRLVKTLNTVATKAERLVESAEAVGEMFKKAAGPINVLRFVQGIVDVVGKHKRDNK